MPSPIKLDSNATLSWITAIVLTASALVTIGATSKNNKDAIKALRIEALDKNDLITEIRLQVKENEMNNKALLSNQKKMMAKMGIL